MHYSALLTLLSVFSDLLLDFLVIYLLLKVLNIG